MTNDRLNATEKKEEAEWLIDRFVRRYSAGDRDLGYRELLRYAAVPIVLTPELVGYLRGQFLPLLPWVAEADLLLSDLCRVVGYERYVMDSGVQAVLVEELEILEPEKVELVARLLVGYVQHVARTNPYFTARQQKHQQWAAMLCVAELRDEAVGQMAIEFEHLSGVVTVQESFGAGRSELAWLAQVVQDLAPRLLEHSGLVRLAVAVSEAVRKPERLDVGVRSETFVVGDRTLAFPVGLLGGRSGFPALSSFEFETVEIGDGEDFEEPGGEYRSSWRRVKHEFEVATIGFSKKKKVIIERESQECWQYLEDLGDGVDLPLVQIPGRSFLMGAPEEELESESDERPQHSVMVPEFFMGQYAVTQAQWKVVAGMPQIEIELNPDPSGFKGDDRPVETVSWDEAIEFCARLSEHTGRDYRLPSEAEWEYACRGGTTTAFSFGETIDAEVANYQAQDWEYEGTTYPGKYGKGQLGEYRETTTPVGTFPANIYGLYDMHGNVWEWCEDHWHGDYEGAPEDGIAWLENGSKPDAARVLRGGSWDFYPWRCRSACRDCLAAGSRTTSASVFEL